jgi:hypothetical protein
VRAAITIDRALSDPNLLGAGLGDGETWQTWRITLTAAFGLRLTDAERKVFAAIAGDRGLPGHVVRELWCVCGRRSGKTRIAAAISVYIAAIVQHHLTRHR